MLEIFISNFLKCRQFQISKYNMNSSFFKFVTVTIIVSNIAGSNTSGFCEKNFFLKKWFLPGGYGT